MNIFKHKIKKKFRFTLGLSYKASALRNGLKNKKIFFDGNNEKYKLTQSPIKNYTNCRQFNFNFARDEKK